VRIFLPRRYLSWAFPRRLSPSTAQDRGVLCSCFALQSARRPVAWLADYVEIGNARHFSRARERRPGQPVYNSQPLLTSAGKWLTDCCPTNPIGSRICRSPLYLRRPDTPASLLGGSADTRPSSCSHCTQLAWVTQLAGGSPRWPKKGWWYGLPLENSPRGGAGNRRRRHPQTRNAVRCTRSESAEALRQADVPRSNSPHAAPQMAADHLGGDAALRPR
jgi:hypothetical protein